MSNRTKYNFKNKFFLILVVITVASLAFIFLNSGRYNLLSRENSAYAAEPGIGANAVKRNISTKIDISLLSDKKFQALVDNLPRQIKSYPVGKADIFEPN